MVLQISHPAIDAYFNKFPTKDPVDTIVQCLHFLDSVSSDEHINSNSLSLRLTSQLQDMLCNIKNIVTETVTVNNAQITQSFNEKFQDKIDNSQGVIVSKVGELQRNFDSVFKTSDNSSTKGAQSEVLVEKLLREHFKDKATVARVGSEKESCDILFTRPGKQSIRIENKNHARAVAKTEVDKFINDICRTKECGLFLSQSSKIVGKEMFQLEFIQNEFPVLFISNVSHNLDKILLGIDIIDSMFAQLAVLRNMKNKFEATDDCSANLLLYNELLPKEIVSSVNQELTELFNVKLTMQETLANHVVQSKITADALQRHIDSIHFRSLNEFLVNSKYRRPELLSAPTAKKARKQPVKNSTLVQSM